MGDMSYEGHGIIYCITNKLNNKVYVGQTRMEFSRRYAGGKWWKYTSNSHLKFAAVKYGFDNFEVSIIDIAKDEQELNDQEAYWILSKNSTDPNFGYNIFEGGVRSYDGSASNRTVVLPPEVREKISQTLLETWKDPVLREKHSEALRAWWTSLSEDHVDEILEKRAITRSDPEWRAYLSERIKEGHSQMTPEAKRLQYEHQAVAVASRDPGEKSNDYLVRSDKLAQYHASMSLEQKTERAKKISATMTANSDPEDYKRRMAKRNNRSPQETELSEVKRILDRFGPSWTPKKRSKWYGNMERFDKIKATILSEDGV